MIDRTELRKLAKARLKDAEVLSASQRYDGAVYVCGYAVELALKARICRTLHWAEFPETNNEFKGLTSLKTHNFDILLKLSGREPHVKLKNLADWSIATLWGPELRYRAAGTATKTEASDMIGAVGKLLRALV